MSRYERYARGKRTWAIAIDGSTVLTRDPGPPLARSARSMRSAAAARKEYERLRGSKLADGYRLAGPAVYGDVPAPRAAARPARPVATTFATLFAELEIRARGNHRPSSDSALDAFEKKAHVRLPESYRAFARAFGPGELGGYVRIHAPTWRGRGADLGRLGALYGDVLDVYVEELGERHRAMLARAVPFADTIGGDLFVWDFARESAEPRAFLLPRSARKPRPIEAPRSFDAFVRDVCLGRAFLARALSMPDYESTRTFVCMGR